MGRAVAYRAHLSGARIGQEVFRGRYAFVADRRLLCLRPFLRGTFRLCARPEERSLQTRATGPGPDARLGWPPDDRLRRRNDRKPRAIGTAALAARAETRSGCERQRCKTRRHNRCARLHFVKLEGLSLVHVVGMAREYSDPPAEALASGKLLGLRCIARRRC